MPTAVGINQIVKSFGSGPAAVDGVSLRVEPGELFFLLGPSGCGKTTLLRMIAGFTDPTAGTIVFDTPAGKRDVTNLPPNKRNTGMVFQSYALWPHMTVAANVAFGLQVRKIARQEMDQRIKEALGLVQMSSYADRKPNQLSGGQQQRIALARALVVRPDVLLLDEPLSNLDAKLRIELRGEIRRICKASGITTVYVTHDQKEALSMADRVAIMSAGRVVQLGPPGELYRQPRSRFVAEFLGETNFIPVHRGAAPTPAAAGGNSGTRVATAAGGLVSARSAPEGDLVVSIRPEAFRVSRNGEMSGTNALRGSIVETTYLGELAQHIVELKRAEPPSGPPIRVKVAVLNPGSVATGHRPGGDIMLAVDPDDVVLIPAAELARTT